MKQGVVYPKLRLRDSNFRQGNGAWGVDNQIRRDGEDGLAWKRVR